MAKRDKNNTPPCLWHYTEEGSRSGDKCTFSHVIQLNKEEKKVINVLAKKRAASRSKSRETRDAKRDKEKPLCRLFQQGKCHYGENCQFRHEK